MNAPLLEVVNNPPAAPAELLKVSIAVKGIAITMDEFSALYSQLHAQGFLREAKANPNLSTMIESSYKIKGVEFSRTELIDLVEKMRTIANQFQNAVRV